MVPRRGAIVNQPVMANTIIETSYFLINSSTDKALYQINVN